MSVVPLGNARCWECGRYATRIAPTAAPEDAAPPVGCAECFPDWPHREEGEKEHDAHCEREYTENGFIFIDCLCNLRSAKAEAWDEGHRFTGYEPEPGENPYRDASKGTRS